MTKSALVVVLGDIVRSPRMQNHCISLAQNGYQVTVIANETTGDETVIEHQKIRQLLMRNNNVDFKKYLPTPVAYLFKTIWLTLTLIGQLIRAPIPDVILVQNPPSIPTLPVLYFYRKLVRSRLVIDWHNYGFTIASLSLGSRHPLVRVMKLLEIFFGRLADAGFCVSEAMRRDLTENHNVTYPIRVLYDRPPDKFKPIDDEDKMQFFEKIKNDIPLFGTITGNKDRPAIIMSSTSWTEDEDFNILLAALRTYDEFLKSDPSGYFPRLICVITGKGPLKSHYEQQIEQLNLTNVKFVLPWLHTDDYPKMVGCSDLGISLHGSSSGLDLPMKVVDFFGCSVPVLAYDYPAIGELVIENIYGRTFKNSRELYEQLLVMFDGFGRKAKSLLQGYRDNLRTDFCSPSSVEDDANRWDTRWSRDAKPLLCGLT